MQSASSNSFEPSASFVMLYCCFKMEQTHQVLGMKDSSKVSLHITQSWNFNSRTTYVEARSTAFLSLLGYLSLPMESSSKLQLDMIYLKTLTLTWHPILSPAFLRSCQQLCFCETDPRSGFQKVTCFYSDRGGFLCSYS